MIAVDTSSFVAFLAGETADDVDSIVQAIEGELLTIPPIVVAELLSAKNLSDAVKETILDLPHMDIQEGFWPRVGEVRRSILLQGKKANLADSMIAVFCVDYGLPLITRDRDYRHFVEHCGLRIMKK